MKAMKTYLCAALLILIPLASFAATQIIVLSMQDAGSNRVIYNYLCWLNTPNPLPNPNFVSQWKAIGSSVGPSAPQITALQNGTVVEQIGIITVSSTTAIAAVQNTMISDCNSRQAYINTNPGPGTFYGQTWNGTSWVLQ
jgi:hypothetical protein